MNVDAQLSKQVDAFILEQIDTIPHLEALLLFWHSRPKEWTVEEIASALYVDPATAGSILQSLTRRGLVVGDNTAEKYGYNSISRERDSLVEAVDAIYRRELIRISRMIHSKAAPSVREFAEAFRFKKDRE